MIKAVFPGSFDPPTVGHLDIVNRAARFFDEVIVLVAENRSKRSFFTLKERLSLLESLLAPCSNAYAASCEGLVVDCMREMGASLLVRGVRGNADFSYEAELSLVQRTLSGASEIETIFMVTRPEHSAVRSSTVRELAVLGADYSWMVPPLVERALREKVAAGKNA